MKVLALMAVLLMLACDLELETSLSTSKQGEPKAANGGASANDDDNHNNIEAESNTVADQAAPTCETRWATGILFDVPATSLSLGTTIHYRAFPAQSFKPENCEKDLGPEWRPLDSDIATTFSDKGLKQMLHECPLDSQPLCSRTVATAVEPMCPPCAGGEDGINKCQCVYPTQPSPDCADAHHWTLCTRSN